MMAAEQLAGGLAAMHQSSRRCFAKAAYWPYPRQRNLAEGLIAERARPCTLTAACSGTAAGWSALDRPRVWRNGRKAHGGRSQDRRFHVAQDASHNGQLTHAFGHRTGHPPRSQVALSASAQSELTSLAPEGIPRAQTPQRVPKGGTNTILNKLQQLGNSPCIHK